MASSTNSGPRPGKVYRTREFRHWSANPARFAKCLVQEGKLRRVAHGLFYVPKLSRFGEAPPDKIEVLRAFLDGSPFLISGPSKWNPLGLGSTAMFASTLVYNTKRSGEFTFDGQRYLLRRVLFPAKPTPEFFAIDLIQHHHMAGVALTDLEKGLAAALSRGRSDTTRLIKMAEDFGTKATLELVKRAIETAGLAA